MDLNDALVIGVWNDERAPIYWPEMRNARQKIERGMTRGCRLFMWLRGAAAQPVAVQPSDEHGLSLCSRATIEVLYYKQTKNHLTVDIIFN